MPAEAAAAVTGWLAPTLLIVCVCDPCCPPPADQPGEEGKHCWGESTSAVRSAGTAQSSKVRRLCYNSSSSSSNHDRTDRPVAVAAAAAAITSNSTEKPRQTIKQLRAAVLAVSMTGAQHQPSACCCSTEAVATGKVLSCTDMQPVARGRCFRHLRGGPGLLSVGRELPWSV